MYKSSWPPDELLFKISNKSAIIALHTPISMQEINTILQHTKSTSG